ncbi:hypothetical protein [Catellatospora chokoriensis]|uniref:Prolyl 4-hydroxylase alpha subunit Fe(2+) 2OG dioxygenase domain-containing protein n=1 Tax=Catellatospora chokoriensis TaxID=310353 RepID=A0A8J3K4Y6_9ACTN|nr:hypothetical protein [Catellatospora chokoriensis]GIF94139.1 hypothetical protein Cch02nite_75830 [Catellatospora chokoriensis]
MKVTLQAPGLVVADHVLPAETFEAVADEVDAGEYHSVHARRWDKAWRLSDGQPLRGPSVRFDPAGLLDQGQVSYPTGTSVDALVDAARELADRFPDVAGTQGADWRAMFVAPWLYPVGSALSLHLDGGKYTGAFTFFAHRSWSLHWGGELFVFHDADPVAPSRGYDQDEDSSGIATCIVPYPNRLVLLGPDRPHMIRRVDTNAGTHVRASLAGFFLRV